MRDFAANAFGKAFARILTGQPHQLDKSGKRLDPSVRTAALIGELVGGLLRGHVDLTDQMAVGEESIVEHNLVEIVRPGKVDDRPGVYPRCLHVDKKLGK